MTLTNDQWKKAYQRLAIYQDYAHLGSDPPDGCGYFADTENYNAEACAEAILDDDKVKLFGNNDWLIGKVLAVK